MRILIDGANGYLGARIYEDLMNMGFEVYGTYHKVQLFPALLWLDITDRDAVDALLTKLKPHVVVHAAAIPTQRLADMDPKLAEKTNVGGTVRIAKAAERIGARVIFISSLAALEPATFGAYGTSKFEAEKTVQTICSNFAILRPGLIIGQSPNVENDRFQNRILNNIINKVPAIYDNRELFEVTWAGHVSEVVARCAKGNETNGRTIPIMVDGYKTRFEIARDILRSFGMSAVPDGERKPPEGAFGSEKELKSLGLPTHSYDEIIHRTVDEIRVTLQKGKLKA